MDLAIDASSVINLDNANALEVVTGLVGRRIFISPLVIVECSPTCAATIAALQAEGRIHFVDPNDIAADSFLDLLNIHELGEGETECLAICINSDHTFCCDDWKAREVAATLLGPGRVVGSLRLLKWCVEEELISAQQAFQHYEAMRTAGGFLPDIAIEWFSEAA